MIAFFEEYLFSMMEKQNPELIRDNTQTQNMFLGKSLEDLDFSCCIVDYVILLLSY